MDNTIKPKKRRSILYYIVVVTGVIILLLLLINAIAFYLLYRENTSKKEKKRRVYENASKTFFGRDSLYRKWIKDKVLIKDNLVMDRSGNFYLCGNYMAYATGNLERFEPRIDNYVIELKHLIDTATFRVIEYPVFRDRKYFYSFFAMEEGGTITTYEANKENELMFKGITDSLRMQRLN